MVSWAIRPGELILFEGDSLTSRRMLPAHDDWAFARFMNWNRTYADVVAEWVMAARPELRLKFRNSAIGGSSIGQVLGRFDQVIPVLKPALVILTTGGNDAARQDPLPVFAARLKEYCVRCRDTCGAHVAMVGLLATLAGIEEESKAWAQRVRPYHAAARRVLRATGNVYLDLAPDLTRKSATLCGQSKFHTLFADGLHYNELGSQVIANLLLERLGLMTLPAVPRIAGNS